MYRVDPNNMVLEDISEGIGCISQNTVVATDQGMFFCDKNNIYMHDGQRAKPIGEAILRNTGYDNIPYSDDLRYQKDDGYQVLVKNAIDNPKWNKPRVWCSYSGATGSFLLGLTSKASGEYISYIYAYKASFQRWDKWKIYGDTDELRALFIGPDNETYFSFDNNSNVSPSSGIHRLLGQAVASITSGTEPTRKNFIWESKRMVMTVSSQKKKIKNIKFLTNESGDYVENAPTQTQGNTNFTVFSDNVSTTLPEGGIISTYLGGGDDNFTESLYLHEYKPASSKDFYGMKIRIEGNNTVKIDSIGMVYRTKSIK